MTICMTINSASSKVYISRFGLSQMLDTHLCFVFLSQFHFKIIQVDLLSFGYNIYGKTLTYVENECRHISQLQTFDLYLNL